MPKPLENNVLIFHRFRGENMAGTTPKLQTSAHVGNFPSKTLARRGIWVKKALQ
jgi:hypothetical protein